MSQPLSPLPGERRLLSSPSPRAGQQPSQPREHPLRVYRACSPASQLLDPTSLLSARPSRCLPLIRTLLLPFRAHLGNTR